jgi:hypothetical protein
LTGVLSGFPFSTMYVASSAPLSLPTFFAEWALSIALCSDGADQNRLTISLAPWHSRD